MRIQDYLYNEFDSSIVEEFLMLLDALEDNLDLTIERLYYDYDAINDLFRMFHNLKSATSFLKIKRMANFAHFVENVLDKVRLNKKITKELIDWLFIVSNQFHKWYENINKNEELASIDTNIFKIPKV